MNALNQVYQHVKLINPERRYNKESTAFLIGRVRAEYEFKYIEEIEQDIKTFIENILHSLTEISNKVEEEFFDF
jgi:uncharacterized alpha-E superfamily protein